MGRFAQANCRSDAPAQLRHRGRHGDPTHDGYHRSDDGDQARDRSYNLGWAGPQTPIQLLPSTAHKHHSELLPSMLAQVTTQQQPPRVVVAGSALPPPGRGLRPPEAGGSGHLPGAETFRLLTQTPMCGALRAAGRAAGQADC